MDENQIEAQLDSNDSGSQCYCEYYRLDDTGPWLCRYANPPSGYYCKSSARDKKTQSSYTCIGENYCPIDLLKYLNAHNEYEELAEAVAKIDMMKGLVIRLRIHPCSCKKKPDKSEPSVPQPAP
jgi:hypothetical protein